MSMCHALMLMLLNTLRERERGGGGGGGSEGNNCDLAEMVHVFLEDACSSTVLRRATASECSCNQNSGQHYNTLVGNRTLI